MDDRESINHFSSFIEQAKIKASDLMPFEDWLGGHGAKTVELGEGNWPERNREGNPVYMPDVSGVLPKKPLESMQEQVDVLAAHMKNQLGEHQQAISNTGRLFDQLLWELENLCMCFQESLSSKGVPTDQIYSRIDPDRSVGILNVLWHTVSFTARGNTRPMAMYRFGREPLFTGRIVALRGDYLEMTNGNLMPEFSELLSQEVASLYIPSEVDTPAVLSIKHLGDEEQYLNQGEAARQFLLKVIEMVCAGGYFHEKEYYS